MPGTHEHPESKPGPQKMVTLLHRAHAYMYKFNLDILPKMIVWSLVLDMVIYLDDQNQKETVWPVLHTQTSSSKIFLSIKRISKACGEIAS